MVSGSAMLQFQPKKVGMSCQRQISMSILPDCKPTVPSANVPIGRLPDGVRPFSCNTVSLFSLQHQAMHRLSVSFRDSKSPGCQSSEMNSKLAARVSKNTLSVDVL